MHDGGDVADVDAADALVRRAVDEFGALDALVNNAGILRDRTLVKMTPEEWDAVIRVHLRGHYAPTHAACGYWRESGRPGHIVCTASTQRPARQLRAEQLRGGQGRHRRLLHDRRAGDGPLRRHLQRHRAGRPDPDDRGRLRRHRAAGTTAAFDFWHPDNVAPMVAFLCSDASAHISGKVFGVQGDTVEAYRPFTSVAVIENGGARWDPEQLAGRVDGLLDEAELVPGAENMMAKLRYSMTSALTS